MTNREFYNAIVEANISDELTEFAKGAIEKLDKKNASRSSKPSKTALANEPIKEAIVAFLAENQGAIASAVAEGCEITTAKASALCRQLVTEGRVTSAEVKIPKKGKVKAYTLA